MRPEVGIQPPVDGHLPSRSQQGEWENHFLRSDAAVEERPAVATLVLTQLCRIDKEAVVRREQRVRARSTPRKPEIVFIREHQRLLRTLGSQVFAELVAQVR